jgi:glycosyltransferase involved in cell wall biosynthesis
MAAKLCLNMIVKNESGRILRALASVKGHVSYVVVVDTGSDDNTKDLIRSYCGSNNIPCVVQDAPFHDWSQARNAALAHARHAWIRDKDAFDYILLMDADMELVVVDPSWTDDLKGPSTDMWQKAGTLEYLNRRVIKADAPGGYLGVTHEYLDVPAAGMVPLAKAYFKDYADGANRPDKFKRDIKLLKQGLKDEPGNGRYMFYLANSYRDAGKHDKAIKWYQRRIDIGGWDEELWMSQYHIASCYNAMGNEAEFIRNMQIAYNQRPSRVEPLYDLAHHYRMKGDNAISCVFSEAGMQVPPSGDVLFVNKFVAELGCKEEFAICAFYLPSKRENGFRINNQVSLVAGDYAGSRYLAKSNMFFYLEPLSKTCPSFKSRDMDFGAPEGWTAMNPSVTVDSNDYLMANVRCVNYTMDEAGRYLIKGTDGTANATNPINTRNFFVGLTDALTVAASTELLRPDPDHVQFPLVVGWEDCRLFPANGDMWVSATARQYHADGNCEQVIGRVDTTSTPYSTVDWLRMLREPRETQKNWSPIIEHGRGPIRFMYRPGHVVDIDGKDIVKHDTGFDSNALCGSSQVIPFNDGYLGLVHESSIRPGGTIRFYYHRFAYYEKDFQLRRLSRPFYFDGEGERPCIEFAAGLAMRKAGKDLVISYGWKDRVARIATVDAGEVVKLLWFRS